MQAELKRKTNKECQSVVTCQPAVKSETNIARDDNALVSVDKQQQVPQTHGTSQCICTTMYAHARPVVRSDQQHQDIPDELDRNRKKRFTWPDGA